MIRGSEHFHFAGIGGIGMSALAGFLKAQQYTVSGSDTNLEQKTITQLTAQGCTITSQDTVDLAILRPDYLIYSTAIAPNAPIRRAAESLNIPCIHRSELLAEITKQYFCIAVTGAHGKTTTSAMISHILQHCNKKPNLLLGGFLQSINSNFYSDNSRYLVVEADESDRSMTRLFPSIALITNIDKEHTETYKSIETMEQACIEFMQRVPWFGKVICFLDQDYNQWKQLPSDLTTKCVFYGRTPKATVQIQHECDTAHGSSATIQFPNKTSIDLQIPYSGTHNIENAAGALTAAYLCGINLEDAAKALAAYPGAEQRFTLRGHYQNAQIIDDYAHHPTEIHHALSMARKKNPKRLLVVFQPHRYSRTESLWDDFIQTFNQHAIDKLYITDIYAASENESQSEKTSQHLAAAINIHSNKKYAHYIPADKEFSLIQKELEKTVCSGDLVLFLGAGPVNRLSLELIKNNQKSLKK